MATTAAEFIRQSLAEPESFWTEQARRIDWQRPFDRVCDTSNPPFVQYHRAAQGRAARHRRLCRGAHRVNPAIFDVSGPPKTRALRRTIQAICEGRDPGDLTTLDDPAALAQIRGAVEAG